MDKIDKKLITLLQQNARMPLKALAEKVFLFGGDRPSQTPRLALSHRWFTAAG